MGPQWPGIQQSLGHLMSPLSLKSSPGLPMDTQLFGGFQCPLVTATVSHPFLSFLFSRASDWWLPCFQRQLDPSQGGPVLAVLCLEPVTEQG